MNSAAYATLAPASNGSGLVTMLQFGGGDTGDVIAFNVVGAGGTTSGTIKGSIHDPASTGFAVIFTRAMASGCPLRVIEPDGLDVYAGVQLLPGEAAAPA